MTELELRAKATTETRNWFAGKEFDWTKSATCIHLAVRHARNMGHNVPNVPKFRSAMTAKRKLKVMGFDSLPELLDTYFERIPPAKMRTGDIMAGKGDEGFHALYVRVAQYKYLGWHVSVPEFALIDVEMDQIEAAWRL